MLKILGIPTLALAFLLCLAPRPADARVHVGISFGVAPAYPYYSYPATPYYDPYSYYTPYPSYSYPYGYGYGYSYPAPTYVEPYYGFGGYWGHHDHDHDFGRHFEHERHEGRGHFEGRGHGGHRH
jgi:hypothetical protein